MRGEEEVAGIGFGESVANMFEIKGHRSLEVTVKVDEGWLFVAGFGSSLDGLPDSHSPQIILDSAPPLCAFLMIDLQMR